MREVRVQQPQLDLRRRLELTGLDAREQALDLQDMAGRFAAEEVSEEDAKYLAQRAYNAHRGKRAYEAKLSRRSRS